MVRHAAGTPLLPFGEAQQVASGRTKRSRPLQVAGLFAGIGGIERGLRRSGHESALLCEIEPGAAAVLHARFPGIPLHSDITTLRSLPNGTDLLAGGFPCQDLSQAGQTAGILKGTRSSLVGEVFRLLKRQEVPWVLLENVPFMLKLDRGRAMRLLADAFEELGYSWAYRVVDSLAFGVPQRRERVIFLASKAGDPQRVLLGDEVSPPAWQPNQVGKCACGFYWTEGLRGLGWAVDSVPTLKSGSTIGIPSPPAILLPDGTLGTPDIRDAERMQGFPAGWTSPAASHSREAHRWKLVGNAVTVNVFAWVGERLRAPSTQGAPIPTGPLPTSAGWPSAGWGERGTRMGVAISSHPVDVARPPLVEWLRHPLKPLSERATRGFLSRASASSLRFPPAFLDAVREHLRRVSSPAPAALGRR